MKKTIIGIIAATALCVAVQAQVTLSDFGSTSGFSLDGSWSTNISAASESGRSFLTIGGTAGDWGTLTSAFSVSPDFGTYTTVALTYRIEAGNNVSNLKFLLNDTDLNSSATTLTLSSSVTGWQTAYATINTSDANVASLESWSLAGTAPFTTTGPSLQLSIDSLVLTSAVPEPSTYAAILGFVTLGLVGYRRFRRR